MLLHELTVYKVSVCAVFKVLIAAKTKQFVAIRLEDFVITTIYCISAELDGYVCFLLNLRIIKNILAVLG